MLHDTSGIISGSVALQFFSRTRLQDSDLDVYVPVRKISIAIQRLLQNGYSNIDEASENDYAVIKEIGKSERRLRMGIYYRGSRPHESSIPPVMSKGIRL